MGTAKGRAVLALAGLVGVLLVGVSIGVTQGDLAMTTANTVGEALRHGDVLSPAVVNGEAGLAAVLDEPTATPTAQWPPDLMEGTWFEEPKPITEAIKAADIVAQVKVKAVGTPSFNTPGGAVPTQSPDGDDSGLMIGRPVALQALRCFKGCVLGPDSGFVVQMWGGEDSVTGFVYLARPSSYFTWQRFGLALLERYPEDALSVVNEVPWLVKNQQMADDLNSAGGSYEIAYRLNYFEYYSTHAVSKLSEQTYSLTFLSSVMQYLGLMTP